MVDTMSKNYRNFVDTLVQKYGARWAAIIEKEGEIPAYRAYDEKLNERFLRSARSFYWTMETMGDMVGMPDLEGKFLEVIWKQKYLYNYLYMFQLAEEILMLGTERKIEEFVINMISDMRPESALNIPGLVGFGIGDYEGNVVESYIDMEKIKEISGKSYDEEEVKSIFVDITREIFEKFTYMGDAGFGDGKYMEVDWENVRGWMFPYKDMVATAIFTTDKIDSLINIMNYLLKSTSGE